MGMGEKPGKMPFQTSTQPEPDKELWRVITPRRYLDWRQETWASTLLCPPPLFEGHARRNANTQVPPAA